MYDEFIEDEIISIEELPEEVETMDIEVDGDHLFECEGILTHNSGYDHKENLSLTQMGESIKKVEHADFVGLIRSYADDQEKTENDPNARLEGHMAIHVGKNRSGPKNKTVTLRTKFGCFRINDLDRNTVIAFKNNSNDVMIDDLGL